MRTGTARSSPISPNAYLVAGHGLDNVVLRGAGRQLQSDTGGHLFELFVAQGLECARFGCLVHAIALMRPHDRRSAIQSPSDKPLPDRDLNTDSWATFALCRE